MPTPTETWQDRRGMFQRGKDVHQPGRKLSNQFGDPLAGRRTSIGSTGGGGLEKTDSVEELGATRRRVSPFPLLGVDWCHVSGGEVTMSRRNDYILSSYFSYFEHGGFSPNPPASARIIIRAHQLICSLQSSAANRGLFDNLTAHKRGSQDYSERRASYTEMSGNSPPGLVSGWFNRTFKGIEKPASNTTALGNDGKMMSSEQKKVEERRGVME